MGKNTKIDWCSATWNPVVGCRNDCPYCYARKIAERFGGETDPKLHVLTTEARKANGKVNPYPYGFGPTFHQYRLGITEAWHESKTVFVCSMADLFGDWVPDEWIMRVFEACKRAPQHRYLFLTKNPLRYIKLAQNDDLPTDENMWYGTTTVRSDDPFFWSEHHHTFVSIEPILEKFTGVGAVDSTDWVIIGAETGKRLGKVKPERAWIEDLKDACAKEGKPIFMKDSLRELMADSFLQEFPW